MPQSRIVSATRETRARTPLSRSAVPNWPWRYLLATMLVAVIDQSMGTSTSFCSKMDLPVASVIEAVRRSHWTSSYGETPAREKTRLKRRPSAAFEEEAPAEGDFWSATAVAPLAFLRVMASDMRTPFLEGLQENWDAGNAGHWLQVSGTLDSRFRVL